MNLAVDLGNTTAKYYLFHRGKLLKVQSFTGLKVSDLRKIFRNPVQNSILCSVIEEDQEIKNYLKKSSKLFVLSPSIRLPIAIKYKTPKTLGKDRIAAAVGAAKLYPRQNVLVIDAGTCIKYDFVNGKGEYFGGSISPGLKMRFNALHDYTSKLPLINPKAFKKLIGQTTEESILTGVQQGMINEMNGFVQLYATKYKNLKIVLTGGDSQHFRRLVNFDLFSQPYLTGIGLNEILEYNLR